MDPVTSKFVGLNLNNLIGKIIQAFFEIIDGIIVDIGIEFHQNNMIDHIGVSFVFTSTGNVATYKFRRNPEGISKFNVVYLG
jgi:hypothetical protein